MSRMRQIHILHAPAIQEDILLDIRRSIADALHLAGAETIVARHVCDDRACPLRTRGRATVHDSLLATCIEKSRKAFAEKGGVSSFCLDAPVLASAMRVCRRSDSHALFLVVRDGLYDASFNPPVHIGYSYEAESAMLSLAECPTDEVAAGAYVWINTLHEMAHLLGVSEHCETIPCVMRETHNEDEYLDQTLRAAPFCAICLTKLQNWRRRGRRCWKNV